MSEVIILQGIQGSGKSTWALDWVNEKPNSRIRVNRDSIRKMFGKYWVPDREPIVSIIENNIIKESILKEYDVVIDDMNLNNKTITSLVDLIKNINPTASIRYKLFNTPLVDCIIRLGDRNKNLPSDERIPISVLVETYNKYRDEYNLRFV